MLRPCEEETEHEKYYETEQQLSELQNNIHHIERKMRLTDSEKRADVEVSSLEMKRNDLEIKQLMMEVKELDVRMKRCRKADEKVIVKEFRECSKDLGQFKGKSAKEAVNLLDGEVLELDKKCKSFEHELQLLKRAFVSSEQQLKEMVTKCDEDFENEPTEYDSLQRIRELENEQQTINKNIVECEVAQSRYKLMKEQLKTNQLSYPLLLLEVEKEYEAQQADTNLLEMEGIQNPEIKSPEEFKIKSESGDGDYTESAKQKHLLNENKRRLSPQKKQIVPEASEQATELQKMQEMFEKIKEATGVSDIQDAERRFLVQRSMNEDLLDLKKKLVKSLHELKTQKKQLDSRMSLIRGTNSERPKRDVNDEVDFAKTRLEEQEKRKINAKMELEKLTSLLAEIEARQLQILESLETHFPEAGASYTELTSSDITKKIEDILRSNLKQKY